MAGIGDLILSMMGNKDPRQQLAAQVAGSGVRGATPDAGGATPGAAAGGGATAGPAATTQQGPLPEAMKSPPDLTELYMKLQERQERTRRIDSGIGLIGAAFAHPDNRANIINAMSGGGGGSGQQDPMAGIKQIMDMQSAQAALQQKAAMRAQLPLIAKRYGLDMATATYLFDSGKLEDIIKEAEKPDRQVFTNADGTGSVVDLKAGQSVISFGDPKLNTQVVKNADGTNSVVNTDTADTIGQPIGPKEVPTTDDLKELDRANVERAAAGLKPFTVDEWLRMREANRGTKVSVNMGKDGIDYGEPEKGLVWKRNPDGTVAVDENNTPIAVPYQGGSVYTKQVEDEANKASKAGMRNVTIRLVNDEIDYSLDLIAENKDSLFSDVTGLSGKVGQYVPGTPQYEFANSLETIKANIGFDKLQAMREASPTGGALGQVSDFENRLLQATMGSLDVGQKASTLEWRLNRIKTIFNMVDDVLGAKTMEEAMAKAQQLDGELARYERVLRRGGAAPQPANPDPAQQGGDPSVDDLLKLYGKK